VAIRIRRVGGRVVALCAAKTRPESGDIYLDDAEDHALRLKFAGDTKSEGIGITGDYDPIAVALEGRDADDELGVFLNETDRKYGGMLKRFAGDHGGK
jgi:hypothetical protein